MPDHEQHSGGATELPVARRHAFHLLFGIMAFFAVVLIGVELAGKSAGFDRVAGELATSSRLLVVLRDIDRLVPDSSEAARSDAECLPGAAPLSQPSQSMAALVQQLQSGQNLGAESAALIEKIGQFAPEARCSKEAALQAGEAIEALAAVELARISRLGQNFRALEVERRQRSWILIGLLIFAMGAYVVTSWHFRSHERKLVARWRAVALRHRLIFGSSPSALILLDTSGRIEAVNPAAERLFGVARSELVGTYPHSVLRPWQDSADSELEEFPADFTLPLGVHKLVAAPSAGQSFPVEVVKSSLLLPAGDRALLDITDISDRLEAERRRNEFISTVSHELRTPLSAISGSLGLVLEGDTGDISDDTRDMVEIANSNANRLILLVNDLLDIERIASGGAAFELAVHDLNSLIERAVADMRPLALAKNIRIRTHLASGRSDVLVDDQRIIQVLVNLLSNAIKFSPAASQIVVDVADHSGLLRVCVRDEGPGVPEELRERIFLRFVQGAGARARLGGTGLGLAISREIVERLGGAIHYGPSPEAEAGATFYFELPHAVSTGEATVSEG